MRRWREAMAIAVLALVAACRSSAPVETPAHNLRTELRRERDCRDAAWKADHLGLWYNVCRPDQTN